MYVSLRTTIFWNLCLLMVLSTALISFVVYRIIGREARNQGELSARAVFAAVEAGVESMLEREPGLLDGSAAGTGLQGLLRRHVDAGACLELVLVNTGYKVIAETGGAGGRLHYDDDIERAMRTGVLCSRVERRLDAAGSRLVIAAPLKAAGRQAGVMKAVLPLQGFQRSMKNAFSMIFLYIVINAFILVFVGFLLFSRYIISPMRRLIMRTERIAAENLEGLPVFFSEGNEMRKLSAVLKSLDENLVIERARLANQMKALEEKNQELKLAQREIIQSEKLASVGRLAAGIAHEVGNPVGIILGYIHLLRTGDATDAERADYLRRMAHETERVKNIIDDLLDFAQPSSQELVQLQLNDIVRDTCAMISHHKEFRDIRLEQGLAGTLPPIRGNDRLLRQMLLNLVLNACDAMTGGGGTLTVTTEPAPGGCIRLTVADTGHGIRPEHREKIFDPFFTTKDHGSGLGLSNVHRIVELMEGSIAVESEPGRGTTFTMRFPAAAP